MDCILVDFNCIFFIIINNISIFLMNLNYLHIFYNNNYFFILFFYFIIFLYNNYKIFFFIKQLFKNVFENIIIINNVTKKINNRIKIMKNVSQITGTHNNTESNFLIPVVLGGISLFFGGLVYFFLSNSGIDPTVVTSENQILSVKQTPISQIPQNSIINHTIQIINPLHALNPVLHLNNDMISFMTNNIPKNLIGPIIPVSSLLLSCILQNNIHIFNAVQQKFLPVVIPAQVAVEAVQVPAQVAVEAVQVPAQVAVEAVQAIEDIDLTIKKILDDNVNSIVQSIDNNYYHVQQEKLWKESFSKLITCPSILQLTKTDLVFVRKFLEYKNPQTTKCLYPITKKELLHAFDIRDRLYNIFFSSSVDVEMFIKKLFVNLHARGFFIEFSNSELLLFKKDFQQHINNCALGRFSSFLLQDPTLIDMFLYNVFAKQKSKYIPVTEHEIFLHFFKLNFDYIVNLFAIEIVQLPQYKLSNDYTVLCRIVKLCLRDYFLKSN